MDKNPDEESAIDSLEQKLYDPKNAIQNMAFHHVQDRKEKELPTSWGEDMPIIRKTEDTSGFSLAAKFLVGALILLGAVLSFTAWRILSSRNVVSDKNIDMTLDIAPYIGGGETTPLVVGLSNRNQVPLEEATLTLMYKQGTGAQDEQAKIQIKKDVGTINIGDFRKEDFGVVLYGSEAESRDITVKLEYKVKGSAAKFSKVVITQVVLKSSPISVHIEGPTTLSVGQVGTYSFVIKNNTGSTSLASLLMVTLPTNFTVQDTNPKASSRGTTWQIDPLPPGGTQTITLSGSLSGNEGETATIRGIIGSLGGSLSEVGVVYASETLDIKLRVSPLTLSYSLDTERGSGENLRYGDKALLAIHYKNSSPSPLQNAEVVLTISGDAALMKQVGSAQGYYDSSNGTITWNSASVPELATLAVNAEGTLLVTIPIVTKGTNSPKLSLAVRARGSAQAVNDVVATIAKTYVVQGSASISGNTHYKISPFQNTGPIPPVPNVDTTYSIHVSVSAQNALQNSRVSFVLPAYVSWRNISNNPSNTTYDTKTRTVTWNIGMVDAGKAVFNDIGLTVRPSQVHVGTSPAITGGIVLDADEVESHAHIKTTISAVTTFISGEAWAIDPSKVVDR